jgi:hypothetical protein
MCRSLLFVFLMLASLPGLARAGGVNFGWGTTCYTSSQTSALAFACNTNSASRHWTMTASFMLDAEMPDFVGVELVILGRSDRTTLPDWWKLGEAPDCRAGMARFTADYSGVSDQVCRDWTGGQQCEVFRYGWDQCFVQIYAAAALDTLHPALLLPGVEYYAGGVTIANGTTTGTGACSGCMYGMIWGLASVTAIGSDGRRDELGDPMPSGNECILWNNPVYPCGPVPAPDRKLGTADVPCIVTAARRGTWGAIKSLYR